MANSQYLLGRQAFAQGLIAWQSDNIKCNLLTSAYTPNYTTDQYLAIIPGGAIVATSSNLASKTSTLGTLNAANLTFSSVASGSTVVRIGLYKDTGSAATSPLLFAFDSYTNLPVVTNGGDIIVQWDTGTDRIATLFEGLKEAELVSLWDKIKNLLGIGTPKLELCPGGLWMPIPRVVQYQRSILVPSLEIQNG